MSDESGFDSWDVDRGGIPDVLDIQIDPPPFDVMAMESGVGDADADGIPDALDAQVTPAGDPSTHEAVLEMHRQAQEQGLIDGVLTNIANMKHESLKGIANNLRG